MSYLGQFGLVLSAYLTMGRTGAIATCLLLEKGIALTLMMALLLDLVQIPVYGFFLEATTRPTPFAKKFSLWLLHRKEKLNARLNNGKFWSRLTHIKPLAVIVVSTIPIRGCGIISACILSFMLGYGRVQGTILIMTGSVIGALLTLAVLLEPVRLLYGH